MKPVGARGEFVFVKQALPGPNSHRVFLIWSRWLKVFREKSRREFQASDSAYMPEIHPVEQLGFQGRQEFDVNDRRVPEMPQL